MDLARCVIDILEPFIGRTVADTCVRATALSIGKTSDSLSGDDLPVLIANVRRLLAPVAPTALVSQIVGEIEGSVA